MRMVALLRSKPSQADFHRAISERSDYWYSACLRITRNPDLAADALQDALLSAWDKRDQFERSARLDTWIHRIAINAAPAVSLPENDHDGGTPYTPESDTFDGAAPATPETSTLDGGAP